MAPKQEQKTGVADLVSSIKQHKKFRQLASYSVQCLSKAISPPAVGWERNLADAYNNGALDAITDVLQRHKGDQDVLSSSTIALGSMATNPKYAGKCFYVSFGDCFSAPLLIEGKTLTCLFSFAL
jgi:hypothetical protein